MKLFLSALVLSMLAAHIAHAETAVQYGSLKTTFKGATPVGVEFDVMSFYVQTTKCDLSENDNVNPDGQLVSKKFYRMKKSTYTLAVPDSASIGSCHFRLDSIYLTVAKGDVLEPINFRSPQYVKEMNDALKGDGFEPAHITKLGPSSQFDCPFTAKDGISCTMEKSEVDLFEFGILGHGETYTMDFFDKQKPAFEEFPTYSGVDLPAQ